MSQEHGDAVPLRDRTVRRRDCRGDDDLAADSAAGLHGGDDHFPVTPGAFQTTYGEFDSFDFLDPRVHRTEMVRVDAAGGITGAALASVALHGRRPQPVKLVEYKGSWKIVFEVN
jgi:hypothetical protein